MPPGCHFGQYLSRKGSFGRSWISQSGFKGFNGTSKNIGSHWPPATSNISEGHSLRPIVTQTRPVWDCQGGLPRSSQTPPVNHPERPKLETAESDSQQPHGPGRVWVIGIERSTWHRPPTSVVQCGQSWGGHQCLLNSMMLPMDPFPYTPWDCHRCRPPPLA